MKDYREKELKFYLIGNVIVILFLSLHMNPIMFLRTDYYQLTVTVLSSALVSAALYSFVFVFDSVLPMEWKPMIAAFSLSLPGESIWTDISKETKDKRFTSREIKKKYTEIYTNMPQEKKEQFKYQNKRWYEIYTKVQKNPKVELEQKDYLLCRDLNCCNLVMLLFYVIFCFLVEAITFSWNVIIYLLFMYILLAFATRNKGLRFVKTVIAVDLNESK